MSVVYYTRVRFGCQDEEELAQFEAATESPELPAQLSPTVTLDEITALINELAPAAG
jgi:hypothetical protein